jgi:hypothetical protein
MLLCVVDLMCIVDLFALQIKALAIKILFKSSAGRLKSLFQKKVQLVEVAGKNCGQSIRRLQNWSNKKRQVVLISPNKMSLMLAGRCQKQFLFLLRRMTTH